MSNTTARIKVIEFNIGSSRTVPVGATVRIHCNSSGIPRPSISFSVEKGEDRRKTRTRIQVAYMLIFYEIKSLLYYLCEL